MNNDNNLTLWGHAGQESFAGLTPSKLVERLLNMGFNKTKHRNLELIGCEINMTSDKQLLTYAQRVQQELDENLNRKVNVKTFPHPIIGGNSVNYRFQDIGKFLYIMYPNSEIQKIIENEIDNVLFKKHQGNQAVIFKEAIKLIKLFSSVNYIEDNYKNIRKYLSAPPLPKTVTHKYDEEGGELLIPSRQGNMESF